MDEGEKQGTGRVRGRARAGSMLLQSQIWGGLETSLQESDGVNTE